ncbi:MAG: hypothetical protein J2P45_29755 [Candidatus Dormibacteraeota bacterium]|nr:hypothetical protein [Candidatus Dormibacteraeota bacterium]
MDRSPAEEYLFWRDEILQVMYWMLGEGLAAEAGAAQIQVFLGGDEPQLAQIMEQVAAEGFLEPRAQDGYALTELGKDAGRRSFALEFEGLLGQAHGECGPDCWCHRSAARAAQCATERLAKLYGT